MKKSGTENNSNVDTSNQVAQEELERLIASAPTAIHRQALQQKLKAIKENKESDVERETDETDKETDKQVETPGQPITQNDTVAIPAKENSAPVENPVIGNPVIESPVVDKPFSDKKDTSLQQDKTTTKQSDIVDDKAYTAGGHITDNNNEVVVEQEDTAVKNHDRFANPDNDLVEHEEMVVEKASELTQEYGIANDANQPSMESADTLIENNDTLTSQDDITVEQDNVSIQKEASIIAEDIQMPAEPNPIPPGPNPIKAEQLELTSKNNPIENNNETINQIEKIAGSIEENAVLKQGRQPDNFYVSMRPKSRWSRVKMVFSIIVIALVAASSVVLVQQYYGRNPGFTSIADLNSPEIMVPTGNDSKVSNDTLLQEVSPENTMIDMYRAKSIALDSLLKLDELVESNNLLHTEEKSQIKRQLESAKTQQANGQFDQAEKTYQQVSAQLEDIMSTAQQLSANKSAAELARLNWESYRWNLLRDTQNLPLNKQEIMLIDLETKTNQIAQNGDVREALEGYQQITREYTGLSNEIKSVASARALVASLQQEWRQISDTEIADAKEAYINGIKLENEGNYPAAIDSYRIAENQYNEALAIAAKSSQ